MQYAKWHQAREVSDFVKTKGATLGGEMRGSYDNIVALR